MNTYRVFIRNGRPCVTAGEESGMEGPARVEFDIPKPQGIRVDADTGDGVDAWSLNYGEMETDVFFRPGYGMRNGGGDLPVTVAIDGEDPVTWFRIRWNNGTLILVEEPGVADRMAAIYGTVGTVTEGARYFFSVTRKDVADAATRSNLPSAVEDLMAMTYRVARDESLDLIIEGVGGVSFASLSRQRVFDTLRGIIIGSRLDRQPR